MFFDCTSRTCSQSKNCSHSRLLVLNFDNEPVFATKCVKRRNLEQYVKPYKGCSLITIGDVENAASEHKGGRKTRRKTRRKRRKFNKKSKKLCNKVF